MRKILTPVCIVTVSVLCIYGAFAFGDELKKSSELKSHREHMRFQRDSLEVEFYKIKLKNNESNNSSK